MYFFFVCQLFMRSRSHLFFSPRFYLALDYAHTIFFTLNLISTRIFQILVCVRKCYLLTYITLSTTYTPQIALLCNMT